jgi:hypothetical protein
VRGAHRFWRERFGFIASSVDWSGTHARRRGGEALDRYRCARWPSQSVIRRLYGTPAAALADAFGSGDADAPRPAPRTRNDATSDPSIPRPMASTTGRVTSADAHHRARRSDGQRPHERPSPGIQPSSRDRPRASPGSRRRTNA